MLKLLLLAWVGAAWAQEVPELNAQLYRPPIDAERTLWADDAFTAPDGYYLGRVSLNYANDPLVYLFEDGEEVGLLTDVLQMNLLGGYVYKQVRVGLDVPIYLLAAGEAGAGTGLGDLAVDVKGTILRADVAPVGVALGGRLGLPTSTSVSPVGNPGASGELQAIVSQRFDQITLTGNLGTRFLPETELANVAWNDQFFYRLGAGYDIQEDVGVSLDIAGQATYGEPLSNGAASPVEFLIGGWYRLKDTYVLRTGLGSGLNQGVGSPDARVIFSFAYEPEKTFDRDLDTIVDRDDSCPDEPEDFDQYNDTDGCPDPSTVVYIEVVDDKGEYVYDAATTVRTEFGAREDGSSFELQLHPGEYQLQAVAPQYATLATSFVVPAAERHEVRVKMEAMFGIVRVRVIGPQEESVKANLSLGAVRGEAPAGTAELRADAGPGKLIVVADGYKRQVIDLDVVAGQSQDVLVRLESSKAVVTREKIEILEKVFFDTNKTTIKPESYQLLNDVASVLRDYPDILKIRIEGHTDSRGSATSNLRLSQGRAAAVRDYLIKQGIDPSRLVSEGYGEDRPVDPAENAAAWEKNRRVEFVILERDGGNDGGNE